MTGMVSKVRTIGPWDGGESLGLALMAAAHLAWLRRDRGMDVLVGRRGSRGSGGSRQVGCRFHTKYKK